MSKDIKQILAIIILCYGSVSCIMIPLITYWVLTGTGPK